MKKILAFISLFIFNNLYAQEKLAEEFLEGLPPSVRQQIEVQNQVDEEDKLNKLFDSETSLEKNKVILQKIKEQLVALEKQIDEDDKTRNISLDRFGEEFFRTIQSSFMPVNIPNTSSDYLVDVGDKFSLLLTGSIKSESELIVQRDGSIIVPEFGKIQVSGRTLNDAENLVQTIIDSKSVGVTSYLTLVEMRDAQVLILGGAETVGIFTLPGGSNILSALNASGGIASNGSFRSIEHKRDGRLLKVYDLYDVFVSGNYDFDSTLRTGDTIFVRPKSFEIAITGGITNPAIFEMIQGESVEDVINFAGGFSEGFEGYDYLQLERITLQSREIQKISLSEIGKTNLKPRDSLWVPSYTSSSSFINRVNISGFVNRPGTYYLENGETLSNLISKAGGYKDGAYIFGAALFRKNAMDLQKSYAQKNYTETIKYLLTNIGKPGLGISREILDFLAEELRADSYPGRIVTDFNLMNLSNPSNDIVLQDQDSIVIPPLQKVVHLFGEFNIPTSLRYENSYSINDYINQAGGLSDSAQKSVIVIDPDGKVKLYKDNFLSAFSDVEIFPGTVIYASRDIGQLDGIQFASTVSPILSSLALTLASLNSISD